MSMIFTLRLKPATCFIIKYNGAAPRDIQRGWIGLIPEPCSWQSLPQTASNGSARREMTGSLGKATCEARGKSELVMRSTIVGVTLPRLRGLPKPRGTGVPAAGKALALGVRGKDIKAGVEAGTQVWTEMCPWACIGLQSTEVHIQDLGKPLREAWRKEDGEMGLHYWVTYLD